MELRQLRQFVMVADTLNFREAAERLHMTQPPLSVSIRKLEEELGAELFVRTTHSVRLSRVGEAVLKDARAALFHAEEVARNAASANKGFSGTLHLGFVGSAMISLLPRLLPIIRQRFPNVVLKATDETNSWLVHALESQELDVAIVRVPMAPGRRIRSVTVEQDSLAIAVPAQHPLASRKRVSLADIADEPFIAFTRNELPGLNALCMRLFEEAGITPRVSQEAVQVQTVLFLVESGLGVALIPSAWRSRAQASVVFKEIYPGSKRSAIGLAIAYNPERENLIVQQVVKLAEGIVDHTGLARPARYLS